MARRLSGDGGFALVISLGMLLVLAIVVVSVIEYSSAGSRAADVSTSGQNAYAIAEAGLNDALSFIATSGTGTIKPQPGYAGDPASTVVTYTGNGTATWGGAYDSSTGRWTIKSIGSVANPTGAQALTRTLWGSVQLTGNAPPYSFASLDTACDQHALKINSSGQLTVTNAMYINSCNNSHDGFDIFGTGGNLSAPSISVVGGWETHNGSTVTVNGTNCPLLSSNPPASPTAGCPIVGVPVLADPFAGQITAPTPGSPTCTSTVYGAAVSYSPAKPKLVGNITAAQTTITSDITPIATGDVIKIDNEEMLVTAGGGTTSLTVQRAFDGTTAATHSNGKEIKKVPVTGTAGTAALPAECHVSSGAVTLNPGTYYGGICIGAASGADCGTNIGGSCTTTASGPANVTMTAGTYIMAGGGFFVCGSSTLSAPNVLIYNTQDSTNTAGAGAIDQIELNTTGSVALGPQVTGTYDGLTIFQDASLGVAGGVTCNSKSASVNDWDIALLSMASTGANGALGSISGTIYAPAYRSLFADSVSGTANLAVLTSCILIDGGNSTFSFQGSGLYGVGVSLVGEWG